MLIENGIKEMIESKFGNVKNFSEEIELPYTTVRSILERGVLNSKVENVIKIAEGLNLDPKDLLTFDRKELEQTNDINTIYNKLNIDRQQKLYSYATAQLEEQSSIVDIESKRIVQGRSTAAGLPLNAECEDSNSFIANVNMKSIPHNVDEIVTVAGDSMEPVLQQGSTIFVRHQPEVENGEIAIVSIEDEGVTCKKVYLEDDKIKLVSYNEKYDDMFYPVDKIKIIGKVIK